MPKDRQDRQVEAWRQLHTDLGGKRAKRRSAVGRKDVRFLLLAAIGLAVLVAPLAVAQSGDRPLLLGERNTSTAETGIVANIANNGQSTRQSNGTKGGRAAGYGCDNDGTAEINACANYVNRGLGPAAAFRTRGTVPFVIRDSNRGKVENLNADLIDDREAADFVLKSDRLFAQVRASAAAQSIENTGGATAVSRTGAGDYRVDFGDRNVSACAYTVTSANLTGNVSTAADATSGDNTQVSVALRDADADTPVDGDFNLAVEC